MTVTDIV